MACSNTTLLSKDYSLTASRERANHCHLSLTVDRDLLRHSSRLFNYFCNVFGNTLSNDIYSSFSENKSRLFIIFLLLIFTGTTVIVSVPAEVTKWHVILLLSEEEGDSITKVF